MWRMRDSGNERVELSFQVRFSLGIPKVVAISGEEGKQALSIEYQVLC